jgi:uncharacterized protein YdhG (YjbR/CyaY superfamily)
VNSEAVPNSAEENELTKPPIAALHPFCVIHRVCAQHHCVLQPAYLGVKARLLRELAREYYELAKDEVRG